MTAAPLPDFAHIASVQAGPVGNVSADRTARSGQVFPAVMRSILQQATEANQQDKTADSLPSPDALLPDPGMNLSVQGEAVTLSMIQQMLANLSVAVRMTPEQVQSVAAGIPGSLPLQQTDKGVIPRGMIIENAAKHLQDMKNASGAESFQKSPAQLVAETAHALQAVRDAGELVSADAATLKSHTDSAKTAAEASVTESSDSISSMLKDVEAPVVELSAARQSSAYAVTGGVHRVAEVFSGSNVNSDVFVTSIRDIHEPIRAAVETGTKHMVLRLDPPGLGDIQIRLRIHQGVLSAELKVDSGITRELFTSALPQIRHQLENSGIRVGDVQVDLHDDYLAHQEPAREHGQGRQNRQGRQTNENFFEYLA